jgi:hypothetical protein
MERRIAPRHQMIKRAQIVYAATTLDCAAFDLSVTGARLYLLSAVDVPERVTLRLPEGVVRVARRCWQRGSELGFEFYGQRVALSRLE